MALVVFLRGVNVGRHRRFQPSVLTRDLSRLGIVNIGAAGTFVITKRLSPATVRAEILRRLPFNAEVMICRAPELLDLARSALIGDELQREGVQRFISVMSKRPKQTPRLPLDFPAGAEWQVRIVAVRGPFAVSLWRRIGKRMVYPNHVVEKCFAVPATTRNWNTIEAICRILEPGTDSITANRKTAVRSRS